MNAPVVGTREEWTAARLDLLAREKELNRLRDELAEHAGPCRGSPSTRSTPSTDLTVGAPFAELFDGRSQLLVYHFMFGPDWDEGCASCSFWTDTRIRRTPRR